MDVPTTLAMVCRKERSSPLEARRARQCAAMMPSGPPPGPGMAMGAVRLLATPIASRAGEASRSCASRSSTASALPSASVWKASGASAIVNTFPTSSRPRPATLRRRSADPSPVSSSSVTESQRSASCTAASVCSRRASRSLSPSALTPSAAAMRCSSARRSARRRRACEWRQALPIAPPIQTASDAKPTKKAIRWTGSGSSIQVMLWPPCSAA